jgi:hypothetical protein
MQSALRLSSSTCSLSGDLCFISSECLSRADISCVVAASKYLEVEKCIVCVCVCVCWCMNACIQCNHICVPKRYASVTTYVCVCTHTHVTARLDGIMWPLCASSRSDCGESLPLFRQPQVACVSARSGVACLSSVSS